MIVSPAFSTTYSPAPTWSLSSTDQNSTQSSSTSTSVQKSSASVSASTAAPVQTPAQATPSPSAFPAISTPALKQPATPTQAPAPRPAPAAPAPQTPTPTPTPTPTSATAPTPPPTQTPSSNPTSSQTQPQPSSLDSTQGTSTPNTMQENSSLDLAQSSPTSGVIQESSTSSPAQDNSSTSAPPANSNSVAAPTPPTHIPGKAKKRPHKRKNRSPKNKPQKTMRSPLIKELIPSAAAHWKPLQVFEEKKRHFLNAKFSREIVSIKKKEKGKIKTILKGEDSKAHVFAKAYGLKSNPEIIISIFPESLKDLHEHLELRLFISLKTLNKVQAVMVTELNTAQSDTKLLDSEELKRQKIDFSEDFPSSGKLFIAALDPEVGKNTINSASLELASFGENPVLGLVSAEYSIHGLVPGQP